MPKSRSVAVEVSLSVRADEIFEHIAAGMTVRKLAHRFGVGRSLMWRWLTSAANKAQYREILRQRADDLVNEASNLLDGANPQNIGVVREQVRHRQWLASRLDSATYGDRQSAAVNVNVTAQISAGDALRQIWQARARIESTAGRPALPQVELDPEAGTDRAGVG